MRGKIFKIINSIPFQVKFHVSMYRYYGIMVTNGNFECLGLQKRLRRSRKPLYNPFSPSNYGTQNDHGFNTKIGFKKYTLSPEILAKMCQHLSCL